MERPKTTRQARTFVGLLNVYHDCFEKVAKWLAPLFELCSPTKKFYWSDQCDFAFKQALKMIAAAKLLHLPDFFEPFVAVTDAAKSQYACWAIYQRHKISKKLIPIVYGSQCFRNAMASWSQYKCEAYAAIKCLKDNIIFFFYSITGF